MKICFLWFWGRANEIYPNWRDGLRGAIEELSTRHQVDIYLGEVEPPDQYDAIIFWSDSNCTFFNVIDKYHGKKAICLTTDPHNFDNLRKLDAVFCESMPVYDSVRAQGIRAVRAFGTDTDFFCPPERTTDLEVKDIEFFYPATFSPWKKQSDIAQLGPRLTCIGTVQPDGIAELEECKKHGVKIQEGYFPPEVLLDCYLRAKHVPIPAIHGSERTCLEAMALNIVPTVNPNNKRTLSYIEEYIHSGCLTPRQFVLENYSHIQYAKTMEEALSV